MNEYRGIEFKQLKPKQWLIIFPSGLKSILTAESDDEIKEKIDKLAEQKK